MKHFVILTSLFAVLSCKSSAQKLKVTAIYTEPKQVTKAIPETGKSHTYTTHEAFTENLQPKIVMLAKNGGELQFQIQGNVHSGGHTIHQIKKIRFEKGEQSGNTITLRYYTEIKRMPGKESANVQGYNYTKNVVYKIPDDVKVIKVELYEEEINDPLVSNPKLIAQQTFNFFAKI